MKKYKLICLDLDGTLLDSNHKISQKTIDVLRALENRGVKIAIATGRVAFDAQKHAQLISENTFFIGSNGSIVGKAFSDAILYEKCITKETLDVLLSISQNINLNPVLYTLDRVIITGIKAYALHVYYSKILKMYDMNRLVYIPNRKKLEQYIIEKKCDIHKMLFFELNSHKVKRIESILRNHNRIEMALTANICFEITEKEVNKSLGIKALSHALGVKQDQIVAFGDSENDVEMLRYVGYGVAMNNASEHVKVVSDYVTDSNDNEGISTVLEDMLKNNQF